MCALTWSDIATTTLERRSKTLADNVTDNNALLMRLKQKGKVRPFSGGRVILEELEYADNGTAGYYSGYEELDTTPQSLFTSAEFAIKQAAVTVTISGLEMLENAGPEQMIDLLEARIKNAEKSLMNLISSGIYSDGTGSSGKQIGGLQLLVPDSPGSGTVGGISDSSYTWWASKKYGGLADGGAAVAATNIKKYLNKLKLQIIRNNDAPDFVAFDNNYYELLIESLQAIQVIADPKLADAGFQTLKFNGMDCVCDGGQGGSCPSNHAYMLNTDYLSYRPHSARNMVVIGGERQPVNQDAIIKIIAWAGNMTVSNRSLQGVLVA